MMRAILRLSRTYHFAQKEEAVKQLKEVLPDTLEGWDHLFTVGDHKNQQLREFGKKHAFALLCVAQELNISRCLPIAYFSCIRYRTSVSFCARFSISASLRKLLTSYVLSLGYRLTSRVDEIHSSQADDSL